MPTGGEPCVSTSLTKLSLEVHHESWKMPNRSGQGHLGESQNTRGTPACLGSCTPHGLWSCDTFSAPCRRAFIVPPTQCSALSVTPKGHPQQALCLPHLSRKQMKTTIKNGTAQSKSDGICLWLRQEDHHELEADLDHVSSRPV